MKMLTVEHLYKSFGDKTLFEDISFTITDQNRIGLIGVNGTGKSTLLKIIAGIESAESGTINHAKDYHIEYLRQDPQLMPELTVLEQIYYGDSDVMRTMRQYEQALLKMQENASDEHLQKQLMTIQQKMDEFEAWDANTAAKTILSKLGITAFNSKVKDLSGGQKKRVAIAKSLIQPADLLILDEPTNHLDNLTIEWLETFLSSYKGSLLLVTHDRYFLNRVTNRIFELDKGNLYHYEGNYEVFLEKKAEHEALEVKSEQKHHNTLRNELAWLQRGARARSTKQKARIERIDEMKGKTFHTDKQNVAFQAGSTRLGKKVIELKQITKSMNNKPLIHDFNHLFTPGDRIGIIGPNGTGKTTLLNIMAKRVTPDYGEVEIGETVKIGYYTQDDEELDESLRIIEYIKETAEVTHTKDGDIITAEQMLERFLFSRPQQWTYIHRLSGGEKRRLYLLRVLMTEPNVLFLDEPTNDLDTQTLGVLEEYLHEFPGVVITVSHDRYFLNRIVDRLFVFEGEGKIELFYGNYSDFLEQEKTYKQPELNKSKEVTVKKDLQPRKKLSYKDQKEWEHIEDDIMNLEEKVESIKAEIIAAGSDIYQVQNLYEEQQEIEKELECKMERWEDLSLLVEEIEANK